MLGVEDTDIDTDGMYIRHRWVEDLSVCLYPPFGIAHWVNVMFFPIYNRLALCEGCSLNIAFIPVII